MKTILILILSLCLVGCGDEVKKAMMQTTDLSQIGGKVGAARVAIKEKKLDVADARLFEAEKLVAQKQNEVDQATTRANAMVDRLNYIEPKYSESVGLLWKWRLIAFGTIAAVVGFFVLRQYFPFLKIL